MQLLVVNLYELGQFLRILLWIFLPVFILSALITTYVHYRKRRKNSGQDDPVMGLYAEGDLLAMPAGIGTDEGSRPDQRPEHGPDNVSEAYKGLLWLKNKYEQDREQATTKFVQLKEEHRLLREKYEDLQDQFRRKSPNPPEPAPPTGNLSEPVSPAGATSPAEPASLAGAPPAQIREDLIELAAVKDQLAEKNLQLAFLQNQLDQRINNYHQLEQQDREQFDRITELETTIDGLRAALKKEILRASEVKGKLESSGQLLLKLHEELDQLLISQDPDPGAASNGSAATTSSASTTSPATGDDTPRIAAWAESDELAAV
jgi:hypothetical protein